MAEEEIIELTFEDIAPLLSKYLTLEDIPVVDLTVKVVPKKNVTKTKINKVMDLKDTKSTTAIANEVGLSKRQVQVIMKEYKQAIYFKNKPVAVE